jgi:hypothetical protein
MGPSQWCKHLRSFTTRGHDTVQKRLRVGDRLGPLDAELPRSRSIDIVQKIPRQVAGRPAALRGSRLASGASMRHNAGRHRSTLFTRGQNRLRSPAEERDKPIERRGI